MRVLRWLLSVLFIVLLVMAAIFLWRHFHKSDVTVQKPTVTISAPTTNKPKTLPGDTSSSSSSTSSTNQSSSTTATAPTSNSSANTNSSNSASTSTSPTTTAAAANPKLSATGPEDTLWVFAGATIVGTIGYQIVLRRRVAA